jgi:hypothetical protein
MNRISTFAKVTLMTTLVMFIAVAIVLAATPRRVITATGVATGSVTWTNPVEGYALQLKNITTVNSLNATNQITATLVTSDGVVTSVVGIVTNASNAGYFENQNTTYLFYGDQIVFSSLVATGAAVQVLFDQLP